jgi:hypothetical protein
MGQGWAMGAQHITMLEKADMSGYLHILVEVKSFK